MEEAMNLFRDMGCNSLIFDSINSSLLLMAQESGRISSAWELMDDTCT